MFTEILTTALQSILSIAILFGLAWLAGKKTASGCNLFELSTAAAAGAAAAVFSLQGGFAKGITAIVLFALVPFLISILKSRISFPKRIPKQKPLLLIKNGAIQAGNIKKISMTEAELIIECREQGIEISDIEFAVLDPDGKLHIQKEKSPPPSIDPGQPPSRGLSLNVIIEGKIIQAHLSIAQHDINWILDELRRQNINDVHDILLAYFDTAGAFFVHTYRK